MDYLTEPVSDVPYSFNPELVKITLAESARDLEESLRLLSDCTRIDRKTLDLYVNV